MNEFLLIYTTPLPHPDTFTPQNNSYVLLVNSEKIDYN